MTTNQTNPSDVAKTLFLSMEENIEMLESKLRIMKEDLSELKLTIAQESAQKPIRWADMLKDKNQVQDNQVQDDQVQDDQESAQESVRWADMVQNDQVQDEPPVVDETPVVDEPPVVDEVQDKNLDQVFKLVGGKSTKSTKSIKPIRKDSVDYPKNIIGFKANGDLSDEEIQNLILALRNSKPHFNMDHDKVRFNKDGSISFVFYNRKGFPQHTIDDRYFNIIKDIFFKLFSSDSDYVIPEKETWQIYTESPESFKNYKIDTREQFEPDNCDEKYVRTIIGQLIGKNGSNFKKFTKDFKAGCIMYKDYIITISFHKDDSNKQEKFKELETILLERLDYIIDNNQF